MSIVINKASWKDLEDIYKIELECFAREAFPKQLLEYFLKSPNFVTLIAVLDGKTAGFITGSIERLIGEKVGHIYSVDVGGVYRRRGIGSRLLKSIENIYAERGIKTCYLEVRADNVAAKELYLKHGYKTLRVIKNYYGLGIDGIRLRKDLRVNH